MKFARCITAFACGMLSAFVVACSDGKKPSPPTPPSPVCSMPRIDLAPYGVMLDAYNVDEFMRALDGFSNCIGVAVLDTTFGKNVNKVKRITDDKRVTHLNLILFNEVCARNGNCGPYEVFAGMKPKDYQQKLLNRDKALLEKIRASAQDSANRFLPLKRQGMELRVIPLLESNLTDPKAVQVVFDIVAPIFPGCKLIWNPHAKDFDVVNTMKEKHGVNPSITPPQCSANLDGQDIDLKIRPSSYASKAGEAQVLEYLSRYKSCEGGAHLWIAEFNCRPATSNWGFVDPQKRTVCANYALTRYVAILGATPR